MNRLRHKTAYLLRLLAWKLDPRPELQEAIAKAITPDPVYPTPEAREAGYQEMLAKVERWTTPEQTGRLSDCISTFPDTLVETKVGDERDRHTLPPP